MQHIPRLPAEDVTWGRLLGSARSRGRRIGRHLDINLTGQTARHTGASGKIDRKIQPGTIVLRRGRTISLLPGCGRRTQNQQERKPPAAHAGSLTGETLTTGNRMGLYSAAPTG